jgi:hypothetical protein
MTTPRPYLYSSLPIVTCSTGRFVRLDAYRLSFPLSTVDDRSRAEGRGCLPFTGEVRVDDYPCWEYHLTHMDTQLSKITRPLPLISRALWRSFERTGRTLTLAADRLHAPRTVVHGWCIAVRGLACLACDRRRLTPLPIGGRFAAREETARPPIGAADYHPQIGLLATLAPPIMRMKPTIFPHNSTRYARKIAAYPPPR